MSRPFWHGKVRYISYGRIDVVLGTERVADAAATQQGESQRTAADSESMDTIEALVLSRGKSLVPVSFVTLRTIS